MNNPKQRYGRPGLNDACKQSLYLGDEMLAELQAEAVRLDRSLSWLVQQAWRLSRASVARFPSPDGIGLAPVPGRQDDSQRATG